MTAAVTYHIEKRCCFGSIMISEPARGRREPSGRWRHPAIVRSSRDEKVHAEDIRIHCLARA